MRRTLILLMAFTFVATAASSAFAGAKLKISDEAYMDLGYRIQFLHLGTQDYRDNEAGLDSQRDWKLRRARFRLKTVINEHVWGFLQTDVSSNRLVFKDAFIVFKPSSEWLNFYTGQHMAPANRQNLTSSGALMAVDRPGIAYKSLTWGGQYKYAFTTRSTVMAPYSAYSNSQGVERDLGLTIFGSGELGETTSLKYYAGIYNGIQETTKDNDRFTLRAQLNLWEPEGGYFNKSTYLGEKRTLALGISYDTQSAVERLNPTAAAPTDSMVDYTYFTVDGFWEQPMGNGALSVEAAWSKLDLGDHVDIKDHSGSGWYGQLGYYVNKWQPWIMYETFASDAEKDANGNDPGKYTTFRIGLTYFIEGQNANIKLAYESFKADQPWTDPSDFTKTDDSIGSWVLGFYTTY